MFGFGHNDSTRTNVTNLVSSLGVVATDTTGVGTARSELAASSYGGDKAIFGFGRSSNSSSGDSNVTNLVSNSGVVATDTTGVGTARHMISAASYGGDKALFGFGGYGSSTRTNATNLVSNTGVVATDTTGVGTVRRELAAAGYGEDKAIFGFGVSSGSFFNITNLVSNAGVVASDSTGVGTARSGLAASGYGEDKAIFGFGLIGAAHTNATNLVSNTGVVASDTTGVGSSRRASTAVGYGGDKAIFAYGIEEDNYYTGTMTNIINLVSNTGVVASDTTGVGTARKFSAAAGYSSTA